MNSKPLDMVATERLFTTHRLEFQKRIILSGHWSTCLNCDYWANNQKVKRDSDIEECTKFKARPPAHIIVSGCPDYIEDIPF